ncbi:hypothetical protein JL721_6704 [Aureococcus anophagefferens]|nr:hypothetical protein JL721_6704 [Aureococcus anophagefferens]
MAELLEHEKLAQVQNYAQANDIPSRAVPPRSGLNILTPSRTEPALGATGGKAYGLAAAAKPTAGASPRRGAPPLPAERISRAGEAASPRNLSRAASAHALTALENSIDRSPRPRPARRRRRGSRADARRGQDLAAKSTVAVVSGRAREKIREFVRLEELYYAGSHGFDIDGPGGLRHSVSAEIIPVLAAARDALRRSLAHVAGASVEDNRFAVSVHWRNRSEGKCVYELKPNVRWDKGEAVLYLLELLRRRAMSFEEYGADPADDDGGAPAGGEAPPPPPPPPPPPDHRDSPVGFSPSEWYWGVLPVYAATTTDAGRFSAQAPRRRHGAPRQVAMAHVIVLLEEPDEETPTIQLSSSRVGLEAQPGSDMPIYEVDRVLTAPSPDLRRDGCECAVAVAVTAVGDGSAPAARKPQDLLGRVPGEEGKTTWRPCGDGAGGLQLVRDGLKRRHADCSVVIRFALSARAPDGGAHTLVVAVAAVATASEAQPLGSPPPPEYDLVPTPHGKRGFSDDDEPPPEYGSLAALPPPPPGISPAKPDDVFGDLAPTPPEARRGRGGRAAARRRRGLAGGEARLVAHYEHLITLLQDQLVAKNVENFELQTKLDDALGVTPASAIKDALG